MKIKVLQFTIASTKAGRTQYILNNWRHIDKTRFHFDFVTFSPSLDFADELLAEGCQIHYLSCYPQKDEPQFRKEFGAVLQNNYDVIHIHTSFWSGMLVEHMAKEYGIKNIIIHSHSTGITGSGTMEEENTKKQHYCLRKMLSVDSATHFCACSELAADWLYGEQIPREKREILLNAIETEKFAFNEEKRTYIRETNGIKDEFVIGHVGRIDPMKNHKFLLKVFAQILQKNEKVKLWIVGEGSEREKIWQQIREYHLENAVTMFGKRDDIDMIMQGMDCFAMPSIFEGFPIVLVESQTAGVPSVVSDMITKEVKITDYIDYVPLIEEQWVSRILQLISDKPVRKNGQTVVRQAGLDVKEQVKVLEELYVRI